MNQLELYEHLANSFYGIPRPDCESEHPLEVWRYVDTDIVKTSELCQHFVNHERYKVGYQPQYPTAGIDMAQDIYKEIGLLQGYSIAKREFERRANMNNQENRLQRIGYVPDVGTFNFVHVKFRIKQVVFNGPATIVIWKDGTKTIVKAQKGDKFDPEKGLAMAIAKRALGDKGNYYKVFRKHLPKKAVGPKAKKRSKKTDAEKTVKKEG